MIIYRAYALLLSFHCVRPDPVGIRSIRYSPFSPSRFISILVVKQFLVCFGLPLANKKFSICTGKPRNIADRAGWKYATAVPGTRHCEAVKQSMRQILVQKTEAI